MINSFTGPYHWLSNFYPCSVYLDGLEYLSVEHAYQAAKFHPDFRSVFWGGSAGRAKRNGKLTLGKLPDWRENKVRTMKHLLEQKFSTKELQQKLIDTGDQELVEGNHWGDTFWGVCNGVGENNLGKLLMGVRQERPWES